MTRALIQRLELIEPNLAEALKIIGAPNGCTIGAANNSLDPFFESRHISRGYIRLDKGSLGSVGQVCALLYKNEADAEAVIQTGVVGIPTYGIGDCCDVTITKTKTLGDFIDARLRVKNLRINATFPVEGNYKEYLLKVVHVLSTYLRCPGSVAEEIENLDEVIRQRAAEQVKAEEEHAKHVAEEVARRKAEEAAKREAESARHNEELENFLAVVHHLVTKHIRTLATKRMQGVRRDDYGNIFPEKWLAEAEYFLANVVNRAFPMPLWFGNQETSAAIRLIDHLVADHENQVSENDLLAANIEQMSPLEFEHHCAQLLRIGGWDATVTQASGDQGIDVIATLGNLKAVLQCKKYAQPVGNGAVQEIIAGKNFERADIAAVVSNASFTQSARALAHTTGVHLLHFSELEGFAERVTGA